MDLFDLYDEEELEATDIQLMGFNQLPWEFKRGMKTTRDYEDSSSNLKIRDSFTYTYSNGERDISGYDRRIDWYDTDGTVGHSKPISVNLSAKKLKSVNREIRQGRIDYLESAAENLREIAQTLPEPLKSQYIQVADSIGLLFSHYDSEVTHYIQRGTMEFEDAVNNETDATILAIHAIPSRQADTEFPNGLTVNQSILYQLTGVIP